MTSKQYKDTYNRLFNELPKWKQLAVREDSVANKWSGILTEFVTNVIYTAEKEFDANIGVMNDDSPTYIVEEPTVTKKVKNKKK
jgi:hypothetical protein